MKFSQRSFWIEEFPLGSSFSFALRACFLPPSFSLLSLLFLSGSFVVSFPKSWKHDTIFVKSFANTNGIAWCLLAFVLHREFVVVSSIFFLLAQDTLISKQEILHGPISYFIGRVFDPRTFFAIFKVAVVNIDSACASLFRFAGTLLP